MYITETCKIWTLAAAEQQQYMNMNMNMNLFNHNNNSADDYVQPNSCGC